MKSRKIRATDPQTLDRRGTKKYRTLVRGAFKVWAKELLGDHAFLLAVLRHGLFEFSELKQYAQLLTSERSKDEGDAEPGGVKQPDTAPGGVQQPGRKLRKEVSHVARRWPAIASLAGIPSGAIGIWNIG